MRAKSFEVDKQKLSSQNIVHSENNSFSSLVHNEEVRYMRKGIIYLLIASFITITFFFFGRFLLLHSWNHILSFKGTYSNEVFVGVFTVIFHQVMYFTANGIMWGIYLLKAPFFEQFRINQRPWMWEGEPEKWKFLLRKTVKTIAFNQLVVFPISQIIFLSLGKTDLRFDLQSFPSIQEIIFQMVFFMLFEDFAFYWTHRLLHHPKIYSKMHKLHHEYYYPISFTSEFAHPIEFIFSNLAPTSFGYVILGSKCHYATVLLWFILRVFETTDGHCGYEFPWSPYRLLPFSGSATGHDYHHSHNDGNYGSFFILWDTFMKTNKNYYEYLCKKQKGEVELKKNN
jgi:sterol desaturase/sphingolipid hydroxylase (fatty acid hydroxylase superfamily)